MKTFCLNCGCCHEFVGQQNKPKTCKKCSASFEKVFAQISTVSPVVTEDELFGLPINFLAGLIEVTNEPDSQ